MALTAEEQQKLESENPKKEVGVTSNATATTVQQPPVISERERLVLAELDRQRRINEDNARRLAELERKPEPSKDEKNKKFWDDPDSHFKQMLDDSVKPLNDFVADFKRKSAYDELKARVVSQNPRLAEFANNPRVSQYIDQLVGANKGEITEGTIKAVIVGLRGAVELGEMTIEGYSPTSNPASKNTATTEDRTTKTNGGIKQPTKEAMDNLPPHLRPSSSPGPTDREDENDKEPELNENERRLARESHLSPKDWKALQALSPLEVVTSKIGKPEKK